MKNAPNPPSSAQPCSRRQVLGSGMGALLMTTWPARANFERTEMDTSYAPSGKGIITGKGAGDFDFLTGEWTIRHRRRPDMAKEDWTEFASGAMVHRVLNGMASIEELRKPDGSDLGMGVRVWLPDEHKWADHWTSAATGIVGMPQKGQFIDGDGVFISNEGVDGIDWIYRGVWDRITATSCRWHQSASRDGGQSWAWNWWMEWTRVAS